MYIVFLSVLHYIWGSPMLYLWGYYVKSVVLNYIFGSTMLYLQYVGFYVVYQCIVLHYICDSNMLYPWGCYVVFVGAHYICGSTMLYLWGYYVVSVVHIFHYICGSTAYYFISVAVLCYYEYLCLYYVLSVVIHTLKSSACCRSLLFSSSRASLASWAASVK